ncbi:triacylglycerol lipase [Rhodococcus wratislaviensis]|uniref:Triacylglycerol lipase n=1 Tax=Rhodococcus wratislaviensis TaxID=44752 RepID=A0A402CKC6_RHOWR|nr:triacylglycerol lipase [Rhodococcus wratislaviensis]
MLGWVFGVSRDYPELAKYLDTRLNPLGKQPLAAKGNMRVRYQSALLPFANVRGLFDSPSGDPLRDPVVASVLDRTRMGHRVPDVPMLMYQANPEGLVPVGPADRFRGVPDATVYGHPRRGIDGPRPCDVAGVVVDRRQHDREPARSADRHVTVQSSPPTPASRVREPSWSRSRTTSTVVFIVAATSSQDIPR